jgi:FMNH2-dependent dimethyl sulfone monooxygenase
MMGVNFVTRHRTTKHETFGWDRIEHNHKYELAEEFVDVLQRLWAGMENLTYAGRSSWKLKDAYVTPRPLYGRPILVNATGSDAGVAYAGRYSDIIFITGPTGSKIENALASLPALTARVKQSALAFGRRLCTLLNPTIICRETEKGAWEYHDAIVEHIDREAVRGFRGRTGTRTLGKVALDAKQRQAARSAATSRSSGVHNRLSTISSD